MKKLFLLSLLTLPAFSMERSPQAPNKQQWDGKSFHKHTKKSFPLAQQILSRYPLKNCTRILDFGCGSGDITAYIARKAPEAQVFGLDPSTSMINFANGYYENQISSSPLSGDNKKKLLFMEGTAFSMRPVPEEGFDFIFSCNAFHLIPKSEQAKTLQHLAQHVAIRGRTAQLVMIMAAKTKEPQPFARAYGATIQMPAWKELQAVNLDDYFQPHNSETFVALAEGTGVQVQKMESIDEHIIFKNSKKLTKFVASWMGGFGFVAALPKEKQKQLMSDLIANYLKEVKPAANGEIEWKSPRFVVHAEIKR